MAELRVWAPDATRVEVDAGGALHAMEREERGWFRADIAALGAGADYAFRIDGGDPRPDPRSMWQPQGVHGPSRIVDHGAFEWNDSGWRGIPLAQAIIYELHTGTFSATGDFAGVAAHLDHLQQLGVNSIELLPVAEFPGERGWGYDGVDLYAPHHAYGGPDALKQLIDTCHARGMAVVMDVVYNHVGPEGNYLGMYGPYFTDRYRTPWGQAVNYDGPGSDEVRAYVLDNVSMWLREYHCDGLRLDAVHAILDQSATHLLEDIVARVDALRDELGREMWVIAESDLNDPRLVRDRMLGGYGVHAQWSDNFHHALHATLTGEGNGYYADFTDPAMLPLALRQAFVYTGQYSECRERSFGRAIGAMPLVRFLGYSQNHDQVGNRAAGERLAALVSPGRARIAAALTVLSPFVPLLFQGEEWAASTPFQYFTDLGDRELQRAVSEGRRSEFADFGWRPEDVPDPQGPATFDRSRLRWDEVGEGDHALMLEWYRALIALRNETPALAHAYPADVQSGYDADRGVLLYENAGLLVACNLGDAPAPIGVAENAELVLSWPGGMHAGSLAVDAVAVWRRRAV